MSLRCVVLVAVALVISGQAVIPAMARADLRPVYAEMGNLGYSGDGIGSRTTSGGLQAQIPAGATVVRAYLYQSLYFYFRNSPFDELSVTFDGQTVVTNALPYG